MRLLVIGLEHLYESRRLMEEGGRLGHDVVVRPFPDLVFTVGTLDQVPGSPIESSVLLDGQPIDERFDAVYIRYFYPYISEALTLAEWAHRRGLTLIDRSLATDNFVHSKMYNAWKLAEAGLPVPTGFQAMRQENARQHLTGLHRPVIAKGVHGSKGKYVFRLDDPAEELEKINDDLVGFFTFQQYLEIEREYRVLVLDGQPLGAISKKPVKGDFRRNFSLGGQVAAATIDANLRETCRRAAKTLGYQFAGVDLAISQGQPYLLEVNRSPGFAGFEEATGLNVASAFLDMVAKQAAERHRE